MLLKWQRIEYLMHPRFSVVYDLLKRGDKDLAARGQSAFAAAISNGPLCRAPT